MSEEEKFQLSIPLYKLKLGMVSSSDGISCASLSGLPSSITNRATYIRNCLLKGNEPLKPMNSNLDMLFKKPEV